MNGSPGPCKLDQSTVRAVARKLTSADGELVYRYRHSDGLEGEEGAFSTCTFWLAQALVRIGEPERASRVFRRMLRHANHMGRAAAPARAESGS